MSSPSLSVMPAVREPFACDLSAAEMCRSAMPSSTDVVRSYPLPYLGVLMAAHFAEELQVVGCYAVNLPTYKPWAVDEVLSVTTDISAFNLEIPGSDSKFTRTRDGRTILQQVYLSNSAQACVEMIRSDFGLPINPHLLASTTEINIEQELKRAGFQRPIVSEFVPKTGATKVLEPLSKLSELINFHQQSGILQMAGHSLIVDSVSLSRGVSLVRDPYFGWEALVYNTAIEKRVADSLVFIQPGRFEANSSRESR